MNPLQLLQKLRFRISEVLSICNLIFVEDKDKNFRAIFNITNIESQLANTNDYQQAQKLIDIYHPELNTLYQKYQSGSKYLINQRYDLETLIQLPPNTLGHQYAKWMKQSNLDQDYYLKILDLEVNTIFDFLRVRYIKVHDIIHALLGLGNSFEEEFYLTSIGLGNLFNPASFVVFITAFIRLGLKKNLFKLKQLWEVIVYGYIQAKESKNLLAVEWENYWEMDVIELKKNLKLPLHIDRIVFQDKTGK